MNDHMKVAPVVSDTTIVRVTSNGSISLPAEIRRRWGVSRVAIIDRGDLAVVPAVPEDPIAHYRGRYAGKGPTTDTLRRSERNADEAAERAKVRRDSR